MGSRNENRGTASLAPARPPLPAVTTLLSDQPILHHGILTSSDIANFRFLDPWYNGTMRALGSEGSPSARVRICPRSKCRLGFLTQGNGFETEGTSKSIPFSP
ncbi:hypothetical protein E2C01_019259 [Portunus trituberculatus]|uniref:Uncharacterized protein n=1 Tax=Portunus trituberculatus TaxID=210409 RepID=A0A5B7DYJ8_PORTR|nr:hypothetical protein [Portunus trituberculatus]